MSAFVCIFDRSGADLDPRRIHRLAEPLEIYGDTLSHCCTGPVAIAVRHPSESASEQRHGPLTDPESGLVVAVAGRFEPVAGALGPRGEGGRVAPPPCAAHALDALRRRDDTYLAGLCGSFVVITADPGRRQVSLARDHLGDLKVYFHLGRRWLIAASEPAAILRHGAVGSGLDEVAAARFLGFRFHQCERSFFAQIQELPPAHRLRVTAGDAQTRRYWSFRLQSGPSRDSREEVCAAFRDHLSRSLAAQTADLEPAQVALSLSGGLDSTTLAALAPRGVRCFSWRLGSSTGGGERRNIRALAEHLEARIHWVDGEGLYPLCGDYVDRFVHASSPHLNAFAALKHRLYQAARQAGCRRVLVGDAGDALYSASEYWLRDALVAGRPGALGSVLGAIRRAAGGDRLARRALRRLLPAANVRRVLGRRSLPWLTATARSRLPERRLSPILPEARQQHRYDLSVGAKHTELESEERRLFAQCAIGRGNPFWYWPLLEMVINLPAWWLHDDGTDKVLTRQAMRGLLPARLLAGGTVGLLGTFFLRGIEARRQDLRRMVFRQPRSDWQRYVHRSWLEPYLDATGAVQFGHTILWRVISYELWFRHLLRSG